MKATFYMQQVKHKQRGWTVTFFFYETHKRFSKGKLRADSSKRVWLVFTVDLPDVDHLLHGRGQIFPCDAPRQR